MNKISARAATAAAVVLAALTALIIAAAPADAASALCWVSPDQKARLSVTRYPYGSGIQYHADLNSSTPILGLKYYAKSITISGVALPGTNDQYKNFTGTQTRTVRGYWTMSNGATVSCAVTL